MTIGERIKATRIDADELQKDLAEKIGCSEMQIRRYEKDLSEMTISKLKTFCQHYGVSADYILGLPRGLDWPR